jgi:hypothetical protein
LHEQALLHRHQVAVPVVAAAADEKERLATLELQKN